MFTKKFFSALQRELEATEKRKDEVMNFSREALKTSKKAIYSLHRGQISEAKKLLEAAEALIKKAIKFDLKLSLLHEAEEEFVEGKLYYAFVTRSATPTAQQLSVDAETYLGGVSDLVGELVRAAVNAALKDDYKKTLKIKDLISGIYAELMMFNFRNSPLRRKFDAIKYGLEKLEDLVLQFKLKDKI